MPCAKSWRQRHNKASGYGGFGWPEAEIRLDVRRGGTTVQMAWPLEAAASLGQFLRELLR